MFPWLGHFFFHFQVFLSDKPFNVLSLYSLHERKSFSLCFFLQSSLGFDHRSDFASFSDKQTSKLLVLINQENEKVTTHYGQSPPVFCKSRYTVMQKKKT